MSVNAVSGSAAPGGASPAVTISFPNGLKDSLQVTGGQSVAFSLPRQQVQSWLQPTGAEYQGQPLFVAELRYQVDGSDVQKLTIGQPHNTGTGGYSGYDLFANGKANVNSAAAIVTLPTPDDGKSHTIKYWFEGTAKSSPTQNDPNADLNDPTKYRYYSNQGVNYAINVSPSSASKRLQNGVTLEANYAPGSSSGNGQLWTYWAHVNDSQIRQQLPGYKGGGQPFIKVPVGVEHGVVKWTQVDLGARPDLSKPNDAVFISPNLFNPAAYEDPKLVAQYGIQLFVRTNAGVFQLPSDHNVIRN